MPSINGSICYVGKRGSRAKLPAQGVHERRQAAEAQATVQGSAEPRLPRQVYNCLLPFYYLYILLLVILCVSVFKHIYAFLC